MNRDDITRMAREAGVLSGYESELFQRFAALVAAAEREKVAAWMMQRSYATGHGDTTEDLLKELEWQIAENWIKALVKGVEGEREACAKAAEEYMRECEGASFGIGEAIRARGNT